MQRNKNCKACQLHKTCNVVCLWGTGPLNAKIMLVGEAPGKDEDQGGKPFVGRAGRFLTSVLEEFGISRDEVYISNAVKCRPPDNRTPTKGEIQVCRHYLATEIETVKPQRIICLGGSAVRSITGDHRVSVAQARTRSWNYKGAHVRATYHPAAVLRNPYNAKPVMEDFARYLGLERREKIERRTTLIPPTQLETHLKEFASKKVVALDIETSQLDPFKEGARIWTIGFSTEKGVSYVVPIHHQEGRNANPARSLALIGQYLTGNPEVTVVGHNIKFDLKWLCKFGVPIKANVFDTMIAFHLLDENYPNKSLKHLAVIHTDMGDYAKNIKEMQKDKETYPDMQFPLKKLMEYNGNDCDATIRLYENFKTKLEKENLQLQMRFNMAILKTLIVVESNGIRVDRTALHELTVEYEKQLKETDAQLTAEMPGVNLRSAPQLARFLYVDKKYPVVKLTPRKKPSTNEEALHELATRYKCKPAQLIIDRRKIEKLLSTSLYGKAAQITSDNMIHTTFFQAAQREVGDRGEKGGTVTGRLASDMQQIPKVGGIKRMYRSRWKNGKICQADYSQIELRLMAHFADDKEMISAFQNGKDIHTAVAAKVFKIPEQKVTKLQRSKVKAVNFGIIYGIGPFKLSEQIESSVDYAQEFMNKWFREYPDVKRHILRTENQIIRDGEVYTLFGRKRHVVGGGRMDPTGRRVLRQGVNAPIQGSASELTLFALVLLQTFIEKNNLKSKIILTVHDSVLTDVYPGEEALIETNIKRIFEHPPVEKVFGVKLRCPLKVDVKFGTTWKDCEEYE